MSGGTLAAIGGRLGVDVRLVRDGAQVPHSSDHRVRERVGLGKQNLGRTLTVVAFRPSSTLWSVVAAVTLVVIGAIGAIRAGTAGVSFMDDLEQTRSPLSRAQPAIIDPHGPRLARRVVIVIIDGLRRDRSVGLPYLERLRKAGVDATAQSHYPTWSRPNYVTILTGVPPQASGVRTNRHSTPVVLDSLMDRARAGGLRAAVTADNEAMPALFLRPPVADAELEAIDIDAMRDPQQADPEKALKASDFELVSPFVDGRYVPWPGGFSDSAHAQLRGDAELVVLLFGAVDQQGHAHGADSEEYQEATSIADRAGARSLEGIDLTKDAVIITADHGHTGRGGHGGVEREVLEVPLVLVGAGIRPGAVVKDAYLVDIAPTAAALLGLPAPGHGLGRTLTEALALDPAAASARERADTARLVETRAVVASALTQFEQVTLERRALRIGLIALFTVLGLGIALALSRVGGVQFPWRALLVGVPAFFIVYYTTIGVLGQRFSPSFLPARGHITFELMKYGVVAVLAHLVVGWLALRHKRQLADRLAAANGIALFGLALTMVPAGLMWAFFPPPYVEVPGPRTLVLIPALQVAVAAYTAAVALGLMIEVVVFFARAVDPRVRVVRLERAIERARRQIELGTGPAARRRRWRREIGVRGTPSPIDVPPRDPPLDPN